MTADRTTRLSEIGAMLAERMPSVLDAAIALLESVPPPLDPARPERYEITGKIGAGGQSEVLLGTLRGAAEFRRSVAIKRVRSDLVDARRAAALMEEAHLAAELSHPNVVAVLDVDRDKAGQPFLVMEYVDGVDLGKLIETGPLSHSIDDTSIIPLRLTACDLPLRLDARVSLDCTDGARWDAEAGRLRDLLHASSPAPEPIACPYPGMRAFGAADVGRFFGRAHAVDDLVGRLDRGERMIYVIGPSGSGKSSLVQAGLLPVIEAGSSRLGRTLVARTMRPGERPAERLAHAIDGDLATPVQAIEAFSDVRFPGRWSGIDDGYEQVYVLDVESGDDTIRNVRVEGPPPVVFTAPAQDSTIDPASPLEVQWEPRTADQMCLIINPQATSFGEIDDDGSFTIPPNTWVANPAGSHAVGLTRTNTVTPAGAVEGSWMSVSTDRYLHVCDRPSTGLCMD